MFKKSLTVAVVSVLFFNIAFAQNITSADQDLLAVIKQLQTQIQSLQAQIVDLQAQVQSVKIELNFSRALAQGATGDDVKQLQEFLKTFTGAYPDGLITGYFGPLTEAAVKKFQDQNGIESVGIVGPKTQDKLNVLAAAIPAATATAPAMTIPAVPATPAQTIDQTGTSTTVSAVPSTQLTPTTPTTPATSCINCSPTVPFTSSIIKVLSPNGGEQWQIGGTYTIKYSAKNIASNEALLIYLEKGYDAPTTKTGVNSSLLIGATTNLESYTYTIPSNIQSWPGLGNNYTIKIYGAGAYYANDAIYYIDDSSDATFSIVAGQVNAPPVTSAATASPSLTTTTTGGGYGQAQPSGQTSTAITPTILITQEKIVNIQGQITALQEKLNSTTDTVTRDSLTAQITALQKTVQELQNQIFQGELLPVTAPVPAPTVSIPTTTTQDNTAILLEQISALQNKLNTTTDDATRTSLINQIVSLKAQVQKLSE